jgi:hypothetical protein
VAIGQNSCSLWTKVQLIIEHPTDDLLGHFEECRHNAKHFSLNIFTLKDLQEWLGISAKSAVLVMQYAKQDIDDIKSGQLNFS